MYRYGGVGYGSQVLLGNVELRKDRRHNKGVGTLVINNG